MVDPERAVEFLRTEGILHRAASVQTKNLIGCIGCRWFSINNADEPQISAVQVQKCRDMNNSGTVVSLLHRLEEAGVIESHLEDAGSKILRRPLRKYYTPSTSAVGRGFYAALESQPKSICNLSEAATTVEERCQRIVDTLVEQREMNFTQQEAAGLIGISQARVSTFEHAVNPHLATLMQYADAVGMEIVVRPKQG
jgi:predicted XRE-type DNA-binding protein